MKMTKMKKVFVTCLAGIMVMATVAGCGKFDAAGYVTACLDLLTKGETEQYMKLTENYRTLYKDIYKKAKYTVTGAEKMKDKDGYTVTVEVEQMTGLFDGLEDEVTNRVMEEMANLTPDTTEDEINELVFQTMYDVLQERVDAISYNDPQTVTVEVLGEDGVYSITDDGYTDLDDALIDTAGM